MFKFLLAFLAIAICHSSADEYDTTASIIFTDSQQTGTQCSTGCPKNYAPVCASDGKTYANRCVMCATSCEDNLGLTFVHEGPCFQSTTSS